MTTTPKAEDFRQSLSQRLASASDLGFVAVDVRELGNCWGIGDVPDKLTFLTDGAGKADGVNGWIGVTDNDLLALLSRHQRIDEVNFWQPGGRTISKQVDGLQSLSRLKSVWRRAGG